MAKKGNMREAQAYAKSWNRKMRSNINNEQQQQQFKNFNNHYGDVYNMIQEAQDEDEGAEEAKQEQKKGFFGKMGDKLSAKLFQAKNVNTKKMAKRKDSME